MHPTALVLLGAVVVVVLALLVLLVIGLFKPLVIRNFSRGTISVQGEPTARRRDSHWLLRTLSWNEDSDSPQQSGGGHTAEMLHLVKHLPLHQFSPRIYAVSVDDRISAAQARELEASFGCLENVDFFIEKMNRSRRVKQSWLSSVFTVLLAFVSALRIRWIHHPRFILANGPGNCVPLCVVCGALRVFADCNILFIESITRVNDLSLSGKILYGVADGFLVQWPILKRRYPQSRFVGRLM
ncbi:oligosaccharide biosynthesis protein Alg14 like-domain-containing protein [Zopfochytrium polystomum]|nr:oligosaccharide biosynthesis protein Alg14 like-domain-containing protein [Zopfochytrium polystomum]